MTRDHMKVYMKIEGRCFSFYRLQIYMGRAHESKRIYKSRAIFKTILVFLSSLSLAIISLSSSAADDPSSVVYLQCNESTSTFTMEYLGVGGEVTSNPKFSLTCQLGKTGYQVTGIRGPFRENGACGAQPPIYVSLLRNRKKILTEVIFGVNCFHGPAISSITIKEKLGAIDEITLCIVRAPEMDPRAIA